MKPDHLVGLIWTHLNPTRKSLMFSSVITVKTSLKFVQLRVNWQSTASKPGWTWNKSVREPCDKQNWKSKFLLCSCFHWRKRQRPQHSHHGNANHRSDQSFSNPSVIPRSNLSCIESLRLFSYLKKSKQNPPRWSLHAFFMMRVL